ncbi:peptidyl-prolyl cis-trans isomerase-like 4 [Paramuricea clavata]|uniref:Peptidyl-prolyl cis-trans isomerase n=1 Tax=Paramuricea clavata TaxID=317549 RepID=A0A6S7IQD5_PARCT|nr:peptidyl-prolyl cis-trans isomerase-like 4 [Paramuricea clavata]
MSVILETTIGDLVIDLFTEERPRACLNFLKLCKVKFYNYSLFHFIQRNFLAQTGDPTGSGRGGESIFRSLYGDQAKFFDAETKPRIKHIKKGTVSMVNNGDDMHGSQFFVTLGENLDYLDGKHTVFGEVAEGYDILDKLNETICDDKHRPYQDVRITHTVILDDPFDDPAGLQVPDRSPEPTKEQLDSGRIGADEEIDDTKGKTLDEVEEIIEEKEFKAGAQILEMVGDIPDADIKPPENVLFVCKLNPVTTDEDLEIIFSRFGQIKSCEIIKDSVSKESLQYAFIEYENVEDCERAYFKMDNVLIDDRRIHVDFSQSVAKLVFSKPGAKPVYELINKKEEAKPKLEIKNSSRNEKYDLVFEDHAGLSDEEQNSKKKHAKRKKDDKKRRYSSSEEDSSEYQRKSTVDHPKQRHSKEHYRDRSPGEKYHTTDRKSGDKYRKSDDSYRKSDGSYRKSDDSYRKSDDSYRKSDDSYRKSDNSYRRSDDSYRRSGDSYRKSDDSYRKSRSEKRKT